MSEIEKVAVAYFNALGQTVQRDVVQCLGIAERSLEHPTIEKFVQFLKKAEGCEVPPGLYDELKVSGSDPLTFKEFMTLYYVAKTRMPLCSKCKGFLKSVYFSCFLCFKQENNTYNLCIDCFDRQHKCPLNHAAFRDNVSMLQAHSKEAKLLAEAEKSPPLHPNQLTTKENQFHEALKHMEFDHYHYEFRHEENNPGRELLEWGIDFHIKGDSCTIV